MAYDLFDERIIANGVSAATAGVVGEMCVGAIPIIVRSASVTLQTANGAAAAVIDVRKRPTAGSATGEVTVATITIPASTPAGKAVYKSGFNVKVSPGESLTAQVVTANASLTKVTVSVDCEISPDAPGNLSNMIASA